MLTAIIFVVVALCLIRAFGLVNIMVFLGWIMLIGIMVTAAFMGGAT